MSSTTEEKEQQLVEELQKQAEQLKNQNPEDLAAAFFSLEQPRFKKIVDGLSQRQLKRLLFQLVSHPFTPQQYAPSNQDEKDAFYLGDQMIHNRMIMQLHYEMQRAEQAQQAMDNETPSGDNNEGEKVNEG